MNAFEDLVAMLLEREGFWVRKSFKVELSRAEKRRIGRPTSPRWELDLLAYKGATKEVQVVECKSFLDSAGVRFSAFHGERNRASDRYKIFNDRRLRGVVRKRLVRQLRKLGACAPKPKVTFCLAVGKFASLDDKENLHRFFRRKGWRLYDDKEIQGMLMKTKSSDYEDNVAVITTKILQPLLDSKA